MSKQRWFVAFRDNQNELLIVRSFYVAEADAINAAKNMALSDEGTVHMVLKEVCEVSTRPLVSMVFPDK